MNIHTRFESVSEEELRRTTKWSRQVVNVLMLLPLVFLIIYLLIPSGWSFWIDLIARAGFIFTVLGVGIAFADYQYSVTSKKYFALAMIFVDLILLGVFLYIRIVTPIVYFWEFT